MKRALLIVAVVCLLALPGFGQSLSVPPLCSAQPVTPNIGLVTPNHSLLNWDACMNYNFTLLDFFFGGARQMPTNFWTQAPVASFGIRGLVQRPRCTFPDFPFDVNSDGTWACATPQGGGGGGSGSYAFTAPLNLNGSTVSIPQASSTVPGYLSATDWVTFNAKQVALGFVPLNPANNLSDVVSAPSARSNLGLGTAATQPSSAFDTSGAAATVQTNLTSEVARATAAEATAVHQSGTETINGAKTFTGAVTITGQADGCAYFLLGVFNSTGTTCGSSGGMVWPAGAGVPVVVGGASWGTTLGLSGNGSTIPLTDSPVFTGAPTVPGYVPTTRTVNGHALTGNVAVTYSDLGTIPSGNLPATIAANTTGSAASLSAASTLPNNTTATTQTAGDSSTKVATDGFVQSAVPLPSATTPTMNGTGAVGVAATFARGDHVHPSDTSRVPTSRTVNGHALSADVTVTPGDVGNGTAQWNANQFLGVPFCTGFTPTAAQSLQYTIASSPNPCWTAANNGSVASGTALQLAYYPSTGAAVGPNANTSLDSAGNVGFNTVTTTGAGPDTYTEQSAPSSPLTAHLATWDDATDHRFHDKSPSGVIGTTAVAISASSGPYKPLSGLGTDGNFTTKQVDFSDLSGTTNVFTASTNANNLDQATYCVDLGSTDAYSCNPLPSIASGGGSTITGYTAGVHYRFKAHTANTGNATIVLNGLSVVNIVKFQGGVAQTLADNDIRVGQIVDLVYDGVNMQLQSTLGNGISGTWNTILPGSGNLSISPGGTSIFNTTSALSQFFAWKNTTAATSGASQSSPIDSICGTEWHAAASAEGCLTFQYVPNNGTDAGGTIAIGHSGTGTGPVTTSLPGPIAAGNDGVHPSELSLSGNTTAPTPAANTFGFLGPNTATFTGFRFQFSATAPSGNQLLQCGTPSGSISPCAPVSALPSGFTATTQSANDASTKVATTQYADTQVASGAATFTNKAFDVEGTGNVFTQPTPVWLPAAGCNNATSSSFWDLPTSTPAVPACVTGTNIQKGVLDFADTTGGFSAQNTIALPGDWTTGTLPDVNIYWTTTATSGSAKWTVAFVCTDVAASATDDPAFPVSGNGFNTVTTAAPGTSPRVQTSTITAATLPSTCVTATKELLHIKLFRDGNDGSDTISATARFIGMMLTPRRAE